MKEWASVRIAASIVTALGVTPDACITRTKSPATNPSVALPIGLPDPSVVVVIPGLLRPFVLAMMTMSWSETIVSGCVVRPVDVHIAAGTVVVAL